MRGSHWMEGQDCILSSADGGSLLVSSMGCAGVKPGVSLQPDSVQISAPSLPSCMTAGSLLLFSEPQFSHL